MSRSADEAIAGRALASVLTMLGIVTVGAGETLSGVFGSTVGESGFEPPAFAAVHQ